MELAEFEAGSIDVTGMTDHAIQSEMYYVVSNKMKAIGLDLKKETSSGNMIILYGGNNVIVYHNDKGSKIEVVAFKLEVAIEEDLKSKKGFSCTTSKKLTWN